MFENRQHAGELLGVKLNLEQGPIKDGVVLGITRGGIVVAAEVAKTLRLPLDIIVVKKLGAPHNPELAVGAIGPDNTVYLDKKLLQMLRVTREELMPIVVAREHERFEQEILFRGDTKPLPVRGKRVILADDGIATGATVLCALGHLRRQHVREVVLAVPVIAEDVLHGLSEEFDSVVALRVERQFRAVGQFYRNFRQVSNTDVKKLIRVRKITSQKGKRLLQ